MGSGGNGKSAADLGRAFPHIAQATTRCFGCGVEAAAIILQTHGNFPVLGADR